MGSSPDPAPGLRLQIFPDPETASRAAATYLIETLRKRPDALLCAATGNSPTRTYEIFIREAPRQCPASIPDQVRLLKLDEWGGLDMDDPGTCESYLQKHLVQPLKLRNYVGFNSLPPDPDSECRRIDLWLEQNGPIDLCILGLGINGHLALNEPAQQLQPGSHIAKLAPSTLQHSMLRTARKPPKYGLTLGIDQILAARKILLLVFGAEKAEPLRRLLEEPITSEFPASCLRRHPNAFCLGDPAATGVQPTPEIQIPS